MAGIMVVAAFAVALALVAVGYIRSRFRRCWEYYEGLSGFGDLMMFVLPGLAGLVLAAVAGAVWLVPAARAWAWIPAAVSLCASASMLAALGCANLADWWRRGH